MPGEGVLAAFGSRAQTTVRPARSLIIQPVQLDILGRPIHQKDFRLLTRVAGPLWDPLCPSHRQRVLGLWVRLQY